MSSDFNENYIKELATTQNYTLIDSFCGCGGLGLGLDWAKFKSLLAFDLNEKSVATHKRNLCKYAFVGDASVIDGHSTGQFLAWEPEQPDQALSITNEPPDYSGVYYH